MTKYVAVLPEADHGEDLILGEFDSLKGAQEAAREYNNFHNGNFYFAEVKEDNA